MATKTQQAPSSGQRLSRLGFGLGLRPTSTAKPKLRDDEDWVIPYTGPYEVPKDHRKRDSWGDLITDYGKPPSRRAESTTSNTYNSRPESSKTANTRSKAARELPKIDPTRTRRSTHATIAQTSTARSFINPDFGGVGASPVNAQRGSPTISNRASLSSFFTFGSSSNSGTRKSTLYSPTSASMPAPPPSASSAQVDFVIEPQPPSKADSRRDQQSKQLPLPSRAQAVEEHEYLESYYGSLIPPTLRKNVETPFTRHTTVDRMRDPRPPLELPQASSSKPHSPHPYAAFTFPSREPVQSSGVSPRHMPKESTSTSSARVFSPTMTMVSPRVPTRPTHLALSPTLKPSASTPNLRGNGSNSPHPKGFSSVADRWLSTETWCDVLLPKPRFRLQDGTYASGNPIISPPGSPVVEHEPRPGIVEAIQERPTAQRESFRTHKLRKSKSAVDLGLGSRNKAPDFVAMPREEARKFVKANFLSSPLTSETVTSPALKGKGRQRSPVPPFLRLQPSNSEVVLSLEEVLEEGDYLQKNRAEWQNQATHSFANKRTRSLGRGRAKSLGSKEKKDQERGRKKDTSLEFLAARTLLGSQSVPSIKHHNFASVSSTGHTHRTTSKSSHHRGTSSDRDKAKEDKEHNRQRALGIHVVPVGMCGGVSQFSPTEGKGPFDRAIKSSDTKHISLRDTMNINGPVMDEVLNINADGIVPDANEVGVAFSSDDHDTVSMPDHPYAKGGHARRKPSVDFIVDLPEPMSKSNSSSSAPASVALGDVASRHRLPPHAIVVPQKHINHPYGSRSVPEPTSPSSNSGHNDDIPIPSIITRHPYAQQQHKSTPTSPEPRYIDLSHELPPPPMVARVDSPPPPRALPRNPTAIVERSLPSPTESEAQYITMPSPSNASPSPDGHQPLSRHDSVTTAESSGSSPQNSPRPLGHVDDLENFRDLFYKPEANNTNTSYDSRASTPSHSVSGALGVDDQAGRSGLSGLSQRLAEEYEGVNTRTVQRAGALVGSRPPNISIEPPSLVTATRKPSLHASSPLRREAITSEYLDTDEVASSGASSASHDSPTEDLTFRAPVRFGSVALVTTPPTVDHEGRHMSFFGDVVVPENVYPAVTSQAHESLQPPDSADYGRSSFGSENSNGSGDPRLSDFPDPPPSVMSMLQRRADARDAANSQKESD